MKSEISVLSNLPPLKEIVLIRFECTIFYRGEEGGGRGLKLRVKFVKGVSDK